MISLSRKLSNCISQTIRTQGKLPLSYAKSFSVSTLQHCTIKDKPEDEAKIDRENTDLTPEELKRQNLDRTKIIPVETSIRYLNSTAYKETYGNYLVWQQYRRNHKGLFAPRKTRRTCIRQGKISCGNPCPICRDEYLVLDHRNVDLLKQFISPETGGVLNFSKTGLCQKRHFELLIAVERAMDYGLLTFDVPIRQFDYSEYYSQLNKATNNQ